MPFVIDYRLYPYPLLFTYLTDYDVYNRQDKVAPALLTPDLY